VQSNSQRRSPEALLVLLRGPARPAGPGHGRRPGAGRGAHRRAAAQPHDAARSDLLPGVLAGSRLGGGFLEAGKASRALPRARRRLRGGSAAATQGAAGPATGPWSPSAGGATPPGTGPAGPAPAGSSAGLSGPWRRRRARWDSDGVRPSSEAIGGRTKVGSSAASAASVARTVTVTA
jgi:hypothetical protein